MTSYLQTLLIHQTSKDQIQVLAGLKHNLLDFIKIHSDLYLVNLENVKFENLKHYRKKLRQS